MSLAKALQATLSYRIHDWLCAVAALDSLTVSVVLADRRTPPILQHTILDATLKCSVIMGCKNVRYLFIVHWLLNI